MRDACDESTFPQPHRSLRLTFVFPSALHLPQACALYVCLPVLLLSSGAEGLCGHLSNREGAGPSLPPSPELCPVDSGCALVAIKGALRREGALGTPWHDEKAKAHPIAGSSWKACSLDWAPKPREMGLQRPQPRALSWLWLHLGHPIQTVHLPGSLPSAPPSAPGSLQGCVTTPH